MLHFLLFSTIILFLSVCFLAYKFYIIQKIAYNQIKLLTVKSKFHDIFYKKTGSFINGTMLDQSDASINFTKDEWSFINKHLKDLNLLGKSKIKHDKLKPQQNQLSGYEYSYILETFLNRRLKKQTEAEKKFVYDPNIEYPDNNVLFLQQIESEFKTGDEVWFRNRGNNKPQKTKIESVSAGDFDDYFSVTPKISHLYNLEIPEYNRMTSELLAKSEEEMLKKIEAWKEIKEEIDLDITERLKNGETISDILNPKNEKK